VFVSYEYAWPYSMLLKFFILHYVQLYTASHVAWDESLIAESHVYASLAAVFWAHRAIWIKCHDFERQMNSSNHSVALSHWLLKSESESYVTTDGQSASLSWNEAPIWGLWPNLSYCLTVTSFLMWGALSDERTGLSFARVTISSSKSVVSMYNLHFTCY
jgi:hypothetical protein